MATNQTWYIIKQPQGYCDIVPTLPDALKNNTDHSEESSVLEHWGPFASEGEAIAKRIGLIRAGKCQPR